MSTRRRSGRQSNALVELIKLDQYGVLWFGLIFLAVMIARWMFVQPLVLEGEGCVLCVLLLLWLMSMGVALINPALWYVWTERAEKNIGLMFALPASAIACAFMINIIGRVVLQKLYHAGWLTWPETQLTFLLDDMVSHVAGLFLGTAVIYGMVRLIICKDLLDKKMVIPLSLGIVLATCGLMLLGIKLY